MLYILIFISIDRDTRKKHWGHALIRDGGDHSWNKQTISFSLPESASGFGINLILKGNGEVWFKDFVLIHHETPAEIAAEVDENRFLLVEPSPRLPDNLMGLFIQSDPDSVLYGRPGKYPLLQKASLSISLASNEITGFPVAVFIPKGKGAELAISIENDYKTISVDAVHYWPQRRSDKTTSDAVIRCELIGTKPDGTPTWLTHRKVFWIRVDGNKYKEPGDYRENIVFAPSDIQFNIELNITVLPYNLNSQRGQWTLWVDSNRWRLWKDSEILNEMRYIYDTGFTSLVISDPGSNSRQGNNDLVQWALDWNFIERILSIYQQAGFSGSPIISLQHMVKRINRTLNKPRYTIDMENINTIRDIFIEFQNRWPKTIIYLDDELNQKSQDQQALASVTYPLARELGLKTFLTLTSVPEQSNLPKADYMFFNGHVAAASDQLVRRNASQNIPMQWYASGTYQGQEGLLYPNRILTGFMNWKLKGDFHGVWTFQRPDKNPYNDFDGNRKDWCLAYPHANDNTSIYTLQWEAIRLGINDFRYLKTCQHLIQTVLQDDKIDNNHIAKQAEEYLNQLEREIPWFYGKGVEGARLNVWKDHLIDHCLKLAYIVNKNSR